MQDALQARQSRPVCVGPIVEKNTFSLTTIFFQKERRNLVVQNSRQSFFHRTSFSSPVPRLQRAEGRLKHTGC